MNGHGVTPPGAMRSITTAAVALVVLLLSAPTHAGHIPDPPLCELPTHFVSCPGGDLVDHFLLRRVDDTPDEFVDVRVSPCGCPGIHFASLTGQEAYTLDSACAVVQITDLYGVADIRPRAGGTCSGVPILMTGFFVPLGDRYSWASPDQDGDLVVSSSDMGIIQRKIGTTDATADLDGDGIVTTADLAIAQAHLGHSGLAAVGVGPGPAMGTSLSPSWPNPCRVRGTIPFRLAEPERVTLTLYDTIGRTVAVLLRDVPFDAGPHQAALDARRLANGVYMMRLRAGEFVSTRLLIVAH